ncbi:hypothetical protein N9499_01520 [Octadecabacter sp.]|nr:hypothetical protein [Octadecabacter sp.]
MELNDLKNSRVGVFLNYVAASPAPELFASAIDVLIANQNTVLVYYCDEELNGCSYNPIKSKSLCLACKGNVKHMQDLFKSVRFIPIKLRSASSLDDQIAMDLSDFSLAAMSSVASLTKAVDEGQLNTYWTRKLSDFKRNSIQLYHYFTCQIGKEKLESLLCFNGRFFDAKPVVNAAISADINFAIVEVKKSTHPIAFVNELIHSIEANCTRAEENYNDNPQLATDLARTFFEKKIRQEQTGDPVYTRNQKKGLAPPYLKDNDKKIIVVYPTTDDEYKFIGDEWDGTVPSSQTTEISALCAQLPECLIIIKMHPNQKHMPHQALKDYYDLGARYKNCIVERPTSKYDTYELLRAADIVINFASTIGVEAAYFGKSVINIGDTNFSGMKIAPVCISGAEAADMISSQTIPPPNRLGAIKWGSYLLAYKSPLHKFKYSNGNYFFDGAKFPNAQRTLSTILPKLYIRLLKSRIFHK